MPTSSSMDAESAPNVGHASVDATQASSATPPSDADRLITRPRGAYLAAWRLHILTATLCLSMFLAGLEMSIVSTSLLAISNQLKGFGQSSWVVTAYLLTYTGFLIISAKLSDIYGSKQCLMASLIVFVAFSAGCGAAQSMAQLIVCRAFQGVGGAGIFSIVMVVFFDMVPAEKYPVYTTVVSVVFVLSHLLGPIVGGAITNKSSWRWVFLLNIPAGAVAFVLLWQIMPSHFPYHAAGTGSSVPKEPEPEMEHSTAATTTNISDKQQWMAHLSKLDVMGAMLLLAASSLLAAAMSQVATGQAWSSAVIIVLLILSGPLWVAFICWQRLVTHAATTPESMKAERNVIQRLALAAEPVLPWCFMTELDHVGLILLSFLVGVPFTVCLIQVPLRYQTVNAVSPLDAGYRLLPLTLLSPVGLATAASLTSKLRVSPLLVLVAGGCIQVAGISLLSTIPFSANGNIAAGQYGYQILTGFGLGLNIGTITLLIPHVVEKRDVAVATGATNQFRLLGGSIGLALVSGAMNSWLRSRLQNVLTPAQLHSLFVRTDEIATFPPHVQIEVRTLFNRGYNLQMKIIIGFAAAQVIGAFLLWRVRTVNTAKMQ